MVNRRSCVRRCHECGQTQSDPLPALDRRLSIWIRCLISNLAKAHADQPSSTPAEPFWQTVPARIDRLVSRVVTPYATLRNTASYAIAQVDYSGAEMARLNEFEIAS